MARSFNGTSDTISAGTGVSNPSSAITYSAWVNPAGASSSYSGVLGRDGGGGFTQFIFVRSGLHVAYYVSCTGGTVSLDTGSTILGVGVWSHIAFTYDTTNGIKAFVNGVSDGTAAANGTIVSVSAAMQMGDDAAVGSRFFLGSIADCAVWSTNLSSGNITSLFNGVRPINVNSGNLIGWWPLDGYASPETDASGNGNTGTLTGTAQVLGPPALWRISA